MSRTEENPETIIATAMRVEGELKSNGNIRIDGIVSGKVHTSQDLTIGPSAQVDADLIASNAVVAGVVKGNVTIKNSLTISETGKIIGNISCTRLDIRSGALFAGNCRMQEPKQMEIVEEEVPAE
ncbi:MAG: polymer-forming cytoskeletal protein [Candidatus Doudnabacteria bacterium]|nr:polymer-forming cytoskeletal protein [Candidatus Doudnabacteria bacterium]